ncbi:M20/M25/M40 family metallo-hydrolase [Virgibacillus phasianinus]|nr:M20/M25/M40 family metallo-hydrolase [Virgibacillus phasianinus]
MKKKSIPVLLSGILIAALPLMSANAQTDKDSTYSVSPETEKAYQEINSSSAVQKGLEFIKSDADNTLSQQIEMTEIPAVPNHEQKKADYFKKELTELGMKDVHIDETGNVIGTRPGSGDGPTLVLSAHLDIAFEEGVDTTVTKKDGILYAPGIADDTRGLAALLSVGRALNEADLQTAGDIMFVATVGEEDDFRGVKALFDEHDNIDGFITVDGGGASEVTHGGTAGYTIKFNYHGPGGHSYGDFQTPSATHALGRAVAEISDWGKKDPKTTFNVGVINGGTAVNAKAEEASMLTEFRTDGPNVDKLKKKLLKTVQDSAKNENQRWGSKDGVTVDSKTVVEIPGGQMPKDAISVQAAASSIKAIGKQPTFGTSGMTDANYAFGAGVPGMNLGYGGTAGQTHSLDEWYDPTDAYLGPQGIFLTALGLVGVQDLTEPLLSSKGDTGSEKSEGTAASTSTGNTKQGGELPETSSDNPTNALIGLGVAMAGGLLFFLRKKLSN